jgi:hypothetical protein
MRLPGFESRTQTALQMVVVHWLGEVTNDFVLQGALADDVVRVCGNEDGRNRVARIGERFLWSSIPVIPGIWTSVTKQAVAGRKGDARKSSAEGNVSTV